jgi:hypothetical protein
VTDLSSEPIPGGLAARAGVIRATIGERCRRLADLALGVPLTAVALMTALAACGGVTTGALSSPADSSSAAVASDTSTGATAAPAAAGASATPAVHPSDCPTSQDVGAALGMTLPSPTRVSGGNSLPPGATGVVCNYLTPSFDVLVEVFAGVSPSYVTQGEQAVQKRSPSVKFTPLSGVGDQAVSYSYRLSGGADAEGILATKGSSFVGVFATRTPASLSQIQALVNHLLG